MPPYRTKNKKGNDELICLADLQLKGPVKMMTQKLYKAHHKPGQIFTGERVQLYNDLRNETLGFDKEGRNTWREYWLYEKKTWKSTYDESGREVSHQAFDNGKPETNSLHEYNSAGQNIKITHHNAEGLPTMYIQYGYDEKGNQTSIDYYDKDHNLTNSSRISFDERGFKTEDYRTKPDGTVDYWAKIENNEHGHNTRYDLLNPDGSLQKRKEHTYEYDAIGKLMKMDGRYIRRDRTLEYKELEHDRHGNWTARVGFYKNVPALMVVRSFSYYDGQEGEAAESLLTDTVKIIPYDMTSIPENEKKAKKPLQPAAVLEAAPFDATISHEDAKWIAEACTPESFSAMRYYTVKNNDVPSIVTYTGSDIEVMMMLKELMKSMDAVVIHMYIPEVSYWPLNKPSRYTLAFPDSGYLLQCSYIQAKKDTDYWHSRYIGHWEDEDGYIRVSPVTLYRPSDASGKRSTQFEEQLQHIIELCVLEKEEDKPEISMVEMQADGKFKLTTYPVQDDFVIRDLDMHYGYGFEKFHNELMERFKKESRGLVLFHGAPGTGKTYYIRHLLRKMTSYNKVVIYMPPNMVEWLVDPKFMTFMSKEIARYSKQGFFCVLLIEDAEPLLAVRHESGRVQGISNLLNMTDGLLNDMLNLQIICTFNVKIKELDKALLRPGRLIARKEFRPMTVLDANRLGQQIGIKHHFTKPATLAEVYSLDKNKNTLIHDEGDRYLED